MPIHKYNNQKNWYLISVVSLSVAMLSGYFLTYVGFAKRRGFKGDFFAAMYDPNWWDGQGILYGPIFVIERWVVNFVPSLMTVEIFAIGCILLIILSLFFATKVTQFEKKSLLFCFSIWTFNSYFYYAFSVAANPELIELFFLIFMWWSFSQNRLTLGWIAFSCAVLTKLAPVILFPILFIFFSWTGLLASASIVAIAMIVVSIGQNQSVLASISQLLDVKSEILHPESEQFLGLGSAVARFLGVLPGQDLFQIHLFTTITVSIMFCLATVMAVRVSKSGFNLRIKSNYIFAVFMCLLPIAHLNQTHRHTFIFLAPVFIAMHVLLLNEDVATITNKYRLILNLLFVGYSLVPIYFLDVFPVRNLVGSSFGSDFYVSLILLSEPIWTNLAIFVFVLMYGHRVLLKK
jgi:hypothetical protein